MIIATYVGLAAVAVVALLALVGATKTSRPDGVLKKVHPYRRMMFYVMPTRNESVVYFDDYIDAEPLLDFLSEASERLGAHITHAVVAAVAIGLAENPTMNRFVVGKRLYDRTGRWITFSMKRKKLDKKAKLSAVKLQMQDGETFAGLCERIQGHIKVERSGKKTYADKEFSLLDALPRPVLTAAVAFLRGLDARNLLPASFIANDAMYTSVFVANLGSLHMGAGYHHLYEWGSCPLFVMVGEVEERAVVRDGAVVPRKQLHVRYTYDERIDDGLSARFGIEAMNRVLSDPRRWLGCIAEDGSDTKPLGQE